MDNYSMNRGATMQNPCTKSMMLAIGGLQRPGEGVKGFLRRVSNLTGIGFRSIERSWYGQYTSRNTTIQLQQAADHANQLSIRFETLAAAAALEGRNRKEVDALRDLARRFGSLHCGTRQPDDGEG